MSQIAKYYHNNQWNKMNIKCKYMIGVDLVESRWSIASCRFSSRIIEYLSIDRMWYKNNSKK